MLRFTEPLDEFDRIVGQLGGRRRAGMMPMDAYEKDGAYILRFDLPGVGPQRSTTVENGQITVTAAAFVRGHRGRDLAGRGSARRAPISARSAWAASSTAAPSVPRTTTACSPPPFRCVQGGPSP